MEIDPVCFKELDKKNDKWVSEYKSRKYYFCGPTCKKTFDENPKSHFDSYRQYLHEKANKDLKDHIPWWR
jgi:YHS domain-containing protein